MGVLASLRDLGLRVTADGQRLFVEPRCAIMDALKSTIRINKGAILRELEIEHAERLAAIIAARDAAPLAEYRAALLVGRLHLCGNCGRYSFGLDPAGAGTCSLHGAGLLAFAMPFLCRDFTVSKPPIAPEYLPDPDRILGRPQ